MKAMKKMYGNFVKMVAGWDWLPALVSRVALGYVFATSGWGKLHNLDGVIGYFDSLGIPLAAVQAPMVALIELMGGLGLILGAGTRIWSVLLATIMLVATGTAKMGSIEGVSDLFTTYEFVYVFVFLYLIVYGGGKIALDPMLKKKLK